MPGVNTVISCDSLLTSKVAASYRELRRKDGCEVTQYLSEDKAIVGFSGYNGYPSQHYEDKNVLILLEGLIYNKSDEQIENSLREIADEYRLGKAYKERVVKFIDSSDGDFIVSIYLRDEEKIIVFNDRWGRLPALFFAESRIFALSREIKFLLHWISSIEFDPIAMAEFLMYEYSLGEKTLVKGIMRLEAASLLEARCLKGQVSVTEETLSPVNLDTIDLNLSKDETIKHCVKLFKESLSVRVKKIQEIGLPIIADLSSGYDTRALFGGLCQTGVLFTACTDTLITGDESHLARRVTESYGKALCLCSANHPTDDFSTLRDIIYLTDCATNGWIGVSSYYDCVERKRLSPSPTANFMGFGGEFIRHPYHLRKHYSSLVAMLEDAAFTFDLSPSWALAITKVTQQDFRKNLEREAARFPERKEEDRVKHLYFECWDPSVVGEDRHRRFSWTVQPFWGKNLLTFELKHVPSKWTYTTFFIDFLATLDSQLLKVPINESNLDSRVGRAIYKAKIRIREIMRDDRYMFNLYKWTIRKLHKTGKECQAAKEVKRVCGDPFVALQFDLGAVDRFLSQSPRSYEIYHLLTVMSYVAEVKSRFGQKVRYR